MQIDVKGAHVRTWVSGRGHTLKSCPSCKAHGMASPLSPGWSGVTGTWVLSHSKNTLGPVGLLLAPPRSHHHLRLGSAGLEGLWYTLNQVQKVLTQLPRCSHQTWLEANSHLPLLETVPDRPTPAEELLSLVRVCAEARSLRLRGTRPLLCLIFAVPSASRGLE